MSDLAGKPVLISGAGRGLGEAIAKELAARGAIVAVCDINEESARSVADAIGEAGGRAIAYGGDLGRRQVFLDVAAAFAAEAGPIYALVNNASVLVYEPIEAVTEMDVSPQGSSVSSRRLRIRSATTPVLDPLSPSRAIAVR